MINTFKSCTILSCVLCVQVSLVATAPLTNLALAVKLEPSLPKKLKALYIMGGNTECMLPVIHFKTSMFSLIQNYDCVFLLLCDLQPEVTLQYVESLTFWLTLRLPTLCWTATPVPPTSPPGSSAAGTACHG